MDVLVVAFSPCIRLKNTKVEAILRPGSTGRSAGHFEGFDMRRLLAAAVALAPLCMVSSAYADETISGGKSGPVLTSAQGSVTVESGGSVTPGSLAPTPAGCNPVACPTVGIYLDGPSSGTAKPAVVNNGSISNTNLSVDGGATGILIQSTTAPNTGSVSSTGTISLSSSYSPPTDQNTGIVYGFWSNSKTPQNNYGIRLIGDGTTNAQSFSGSIANSGTISVFGNNSYGISIEAPLDGSSSALTQATVNSTTATATTGTRTIALESTGTINVSGDHAVGVNVAGAVTKDVLLEGSISATGVGAKGVQTSADINGRLTLGAAISATGYHYTTRPIDSTIKLFSHGPFTTSDGTNTETLQGGPAVTIGGNVAQGVLLDAEPTVVSTGTTPSSTPTDSDLDGIPDANQTTGSISSFGRAPALVIGSGTQTITLGVVGTTQPASTVSTVPVPVLPAGTIFTSPSASGFFTAGQLYDFGLILKGSVTANGVYDGFSSTAVQIGGDVGQWSATGTSQASQAVTLNDGGMLVTGVISATAYQAAATGIQINSGVSMPGGGEYSAGGGVINAGGVIVAASHGSGVNPGITAEQAQQATAIDIQTGANVPTIANLVGATGGGVIAATTDGAYGSAVAIHDASGSVKTIVNTGTISATTDTTPGTTPLDESPVAQYTGGYCDQSASSTHGACAIAIDSRANTTGLTIIQQASGVTGASAPSIIGDIYLPQSAGASSTVTIASGSVIGTVNLGAGAVNLTVGPGTSTGSATVVGPLIYGQTTTAASQLTIDVKQGGTLDDGQLNAARSPTPGAIFAKSVTVEGGGTLFAAIDPNNPNQTGFYAQNVTLKDGAKLGVNFTNFLPANGQPVVMNFLAAQDGSGNPNGGLSISGTVDTSSIVHPFLFNVAIGTAAGGNGLGTITGCATDSVCIEASRKTAQQAGMNQAQAGFYDAAYANLGVGSDADLRSLFLSKTSKADFFRDYNQLMPVAGGATLLSLSSGMRSISRALSDTRPVAEPGEITGWAQEINYYADHSSDNGLGFRTHGLGVASGVERGTPFGAIGVSAAFTSGDMKTPSQIGSSDLGATEYEAGLYWRFNQGGWRAWARGAAGYATFNSTRDFIDNPTQSLTQSHTTTTSTTDTTTGKTTTTTTNNITSVQALTRAATGNWDGYTLSAGAGASWEKHFLRRYYVRPEATVEYMRLTENGYTEDNASGGVNGIPLIVGSRTGDILTTTAMMNVGARFGDIAGQGGVTVELQAGYRDNVSADPGVTSLQFVSNKGVVAQVAGDDLTGGGPVAGFRVMAGGPMGYVALEGDAEQMALYTEYVLLIRAAFRF